MARKAIKQQPDATAPAVQTVVTRTIDLDPGDWLVATWRRLPPLPRPPGCALPADLDGCWAQTGRVQSHGWDDMTLGLRWFIREAFPYVTAEEWERRRPELRERLKAESWPNDYYRRPALVFYLAALAGLHDELLAVVSRWLDDLYGRFDWDDSYHMPQWVVFGLGSAELVTRHMRRLRLPFKTPEHARAWLAHTEFAGLDYLRDQVLTTPNKKDAEQLLEVLCLVRAPEAAPHLLQIKIDAKVPMRAGNWLDVQVGNAIAGLIPVAAGKGRLAEAAVEYLREAKRRGFAALIEEQLQAAAPEAAAKVRRDVLEHAENVYPVLTEEAMPAPLRQALAQAPAAAVPSLVAAASLPPLVVGGSRLDGPQVQAVLAALQKTPLGTPQPLLAALRQYGDPLARDAFAWRLFELWLAAGAPSKDKWALLVLSHLGGDGCALRLAPLVRAWPGASQHKRAVTGLECLRAIGTDAALTQLNGIAQKLKFKALQNTARKMMEAIAQDRGLTRDQLADRIVPDLGLDERGGRTFDFGPRKFQVILGPDLAPLVRDEAGKTRADLPKPGAKDDAEKATAAVAEWKLLKKGLREALKVQAPRLEQAMVTGRRWTVPEFETLLVRHPLMVNLVRRLLWGGYDGEGRRVRTFRVTEEQEYADAADRACSLEGLAAVGIVHPLHLTAEERARWGQVFGDYEILPPFPQLGRAVFALAPGEAEATEITRFAGPKIPGAALVGTLEQLGWTRGHPEDGGWFGDHSKYYPGGAVTAVLWHEPGMPIGYMQGWEDQQITKVYFRSRNDQGEWITLPLGQVDPVVLSEVLADLTLLASKGK